MPRWLGGELNRRRLALPVRLPPTKRNHEQRRSGGAVFCSKSRCSPCGNSTIIFPSALWHGALVSKFGASGSRFGVALQCFGSALWCQTPALWCPALARRFGMALRRFGDKSLHFGIALRRFGNKSRRFGNIFRCFGVALWRFGVALWHKIINNKNNRDLYSYSTT